MDKKTKDKIMKKVKSVYFTYNTMKDHVGSTDTFLSYFFKLSGGISNIIGGKLNIIFFIILLIVIFCLNIFLDINIKACFIVLIFIYIVFIAIKTLFILYKMNKMNKVKKLKAKGKCIEKSLKVSSIEKFIKGGGDSHTEEVYYIQIQNGNETLYSFPYSKGEVKGTSKENLKNIYGMFGYEYDEKETHKKEILSKINQSIIKNKHNSETNKSFITNSKIRKSEELKHTIEIGYVPTYWEVNGKKITIGDTVNVYFDSKNPKYYWVDLDFLFDK